MQADHVQQQDNGFPKGQFIEHRVKITLPKQLKVQKRILAYKTYNNTYLLQNDCSIFNYTLYHITSTGEIINKLEESNYLQSPLYLISECQVIFQTRNFKEISIKQWDFKANQLLQFNIKKELSEQAEIWTTLFQETQMLCIVQYLQIPQKSKKMSILIKFYQYPLKECNPIPIKIIKPALQMKPHYYPEKLNSHSGIIWKYTPSMYQLLKTSCFYIFDLRHKQQQIQCFKFNHFFNTIKDFESYVGDIWEPVYGQICFFCSVSVGERARNQYKFKQWQLQKMFKKEKSIYYIWDYRTNKFTILNIPSQNKLQFTDRFKNIKRLVLIQSEQAKKISNSKRSKPMASMYKQVGVSYVDSSNFEIMFTEKPSQKKYLSERLSQIQWAYPTYCSTTYFQTRYSYKQNKQELQLITRKYMSIPQNISIISVFFTNQMVTDPDEDLLLFVVGMLQAEEGKERWVNWDGQEKQKMQKEITEAIQEDKFQEITLQENIKLQDKSADHANNQFP